jgi:hypothetical protein
MIWSLLLHSILTLNVSTPYPLRVTGTASSVQGLVRIMNSEAYPAAPVEAHLINARTKEYGIRLTQKLGDQGYAKRENRFKCALNYLLADSSKRFRVRLVENDGSVLIGNGRRGIIDIADAEKFDPDPQGNFTSFNILLHELYEQYQLQVVDQLEPGKITRAQLNRAHLKAIQKESNFYSLTAVQTKAYIYDEYIHIEFSSRLDSTKTHYYAYHSYGNIDRVERAYDR